MVTITFADRETERKGLAALLGRFSGKAQAGGEHLVPKAAIEALTAQNIAFRITKTDDLPEQANASIWKACDDL